MSSKPDPQPEVLQSNNPTKLSSEEIAKAVARHNKHHSADKEANLAKGKTKKAGKG